MFDFLYELFQGFKLLIGCALVFMLGIGILIGLLFVSVLLAFSG